MVAIGAAGLMAGPAPSPTAAPLGLEVVVEVRPGGAVSSQVTPLGDGPSLWAPDRPLFLSHSLGTSCKTPTWVSLGGSPALSSSCPSFWLFHSLPVISAPCLDPCSAAHSSLARWSLGSSPQGLPQTLAHAGTQILGVCADVCKTCVHKPGVYLRLLCKPGLCA